VIEALEPFGVVVAGASATRAFLSASGTRALRRLIHAHELVVLRDAHFNEAEQLVLACSLGKVPGPAPAKRYREAVASRFSDERRQLSATVGAVFLTWDHGPPALVAADIRLSISGKQVASIPKTTLLHPSRRGPAISVVKKLPGEPGPRNDVWHADLTFLARPPVFATIRAVEIPDGRGDTLFCRMSIHEGCVSVMAHALHGRRVVHVADAAASTWDDLGEFPHPFPAVPDPVEHPGIATHRSLEHPFLLVNPYYTQCLVGADETESRHMLQDVYRQTIVPANIYQHRWRAGDVVVWNNLSVLHYGVRDCLASDTRILHRTLSCWGGRPISLTTPTSNFT